VTHAPKQSSPLTGLDIYLVGSGNAGWCLKLRRGEIGGRHEMGKVYDVFADEYIDEEDMDVIAPPERYKPITPDIVIKNAARWICDALVENNKKDER